MRNYKKYLAAILAATMTIGAPAAAMAASVSPTEYTDPNEATGTITGTGGVEGSRSTDVFKVAVTTIPTDSTMYNFILDPEGLIEASGATKYGSKKFAPSTTMYFENVTDKNANSDDYSNRSDYLTVINKGTMNVDATVTAKVSGLGSIKLAASSAFTNDTDASIFMELVDDGTGHAAVTDDGASLTKEIVASTTPNLWKTVYDAATQTYVYTENPSVTATYNESKFALSGASNPAGDWSNLTEATPTVEVVWKVVEHVTPAAPSIATTTYANTGEAVNVTFDLGKGNLAATAIASVKNGTTELLGGDMIKVEGTTLTVKAKYLTTLTTTTTLAVEFNDTAKTKVNLRFTK